MRLVEAYAKEQGIFLTPKCADPVYNDTLELDLSKVTPSLAGPKRPQDRIDLKDVKKNFLTGLGEEPRKTAVNMDGEGRRGAGWIRRHRGHHELHEYVQSVRDACRRVCSQRRLSKVD